MQDAVSLQSALEQIYRSDRSRILAILRRAYPLACDGCAEDALHACFSAAMTRPAFAESLRLGGGAALRNLVILAARRMLRQGQRKKDSGNLEWTEDHAKNAGETPETVLIATQTVRRIERVMADAAHRHGRGKREAVHAALTWRLTHGRRDLEAAKRFGVPRKYLHLARRFVEQQILPG